jgi:hypothetical protein
MPTVVDVDEIHTPEYEKTTLHVEEEKEPAQEDPSSHKRMLNGRNLTRPGEKGHNKQNRPWVPRSKA